MPNYTANLTRLTMNSMEFADSLDHTMKHTAELPPMQIDALIIHLGRISKNINGHLATLKTIQAGASPARTTAIPTQKQQ